MKSILLTIVIVLYSIGCYCQVLRTDGEPFSGSVSICNECTTDNYNNPNSRLIVTSNLSLDKLGVSGNAVVGKPKREIGRMIVDFMPNKDGIITFTADQCRALNIVIPDFVRGNGEYQMHIVYDSKSTSIDNHQQEDYQQYKQKPEDAQNYSTERYEAYAVYYSDSTLILFYDNNKPKEAFDIRTRLDNGWGSIGKQIKTVIFDDSFYIYRPTSCDYLFADCSNLTTIIGINNLNTERVTSMVKMFSNCVELTGIDVSGFNTSMVTNMQYMFEGCEKIQRLNVKGFNTSNVTDMSEMFARCINLIKLDVSGFNTEKVTNMCAMFDSCKKLATLDIQNFNTSQVTDMSWMFEDCENLKGLDVSGFNTEKVINMRGLFSRCKNLIEIDVSGFNTTNVIYMDAMFQDCCSITELDVSNFITTKVKDMGCMFNCCSNLIKINLSSFRTNKIEDMRLMFQGCCSLSVLDLRTFKTKNVANMEGMFNDCKNLKRIYVSSKWSTKKVTESEKMFLDCSNLIGGKGSRYNSGKTDISYAHIDGGKSNPGYFTKKR